MTTPTTAELLKYADLQMAAEAFLANPDGSIRTDLKAALIDGNKHNSKFTETQATNFFAHWEVVAQKPNTATGFSGTLFKCVQDDPTTGAKAGELVMSFRSTEFIDDAARDNQATNALEIKETGFAWGQLRDMQDWYQELTSSGGPLGAGQTFSVTGYSLGGHLATAFNMMYAAAKETFTFNGAGIGGIDPTTTLKSLVDTFTTESRRDHTADITDPTLKAIYTRLRAASQSGGEVFAGDLSTLAALTRSTDANYVDADTVKQAIMVQQAWLRVDSIRSEVTRLGSLSSGDGKQPNPIANTAIAQEGMDYQMAVLTVSAHTDAASLLAGIARAYHGKVNSLTLDNQFDVVGATSPSAVSNSQWHIGTDAQVFIEDQPLYRGGVGGGALLETLKHFDVKLLVDGYATKDFGDTHSLVLLVDSLNVQNTILQMLPEGQRGAAAQTLQQVLIEASNLKRFDGALLVGGDQGKAEGDVLENTLNALADLVLGPGKYTRLKGSATGGTWAEVDDKGGYTGRDSLYTLLAKIQASDLYQAAQKGDVSLKLNTSPSTLVAQAHTDFGAFAALYSLSSFAFELGQSTAIPQKMQVGWGDVYQAWKKDKDNAGSSQPRNFTDLWMTDRAALLARKNYYNTANAAYDSSKPDAYGQASATLYDPDNTIWEDRQTQLTIQRGQVAGNTKHIIFGSDTGNTFVRGNAIKNVAVCAISTRSRGRFNHSTPRHNTTKHQGANV